MTRQALLLIALCGAAAAADMTRADLDQFVDRTKVFWGSFAKFTDAEREAKVVELHGSNDFEFCHSLSEACVTSREAFNQFASMASVITNFGIDISDVLYGQNQVAYTWRATYLCANNKITGTRGVLVYKFDAATHKVLTVFDAFDASALSNIVMTCSGADTVEDAGLDMPRKQLEGAVAESVAAFNAAASESANVELFLATLADEFEFCTSFDEPGKCTTDRSALVALLKQWASITRFSTRQYGDIMAGVNQVFYTWECNYAAPNGEVAALHGGIIMYLNKAGKVTKAMDYLDVPNASIYMARASVPKTKDEL